MVHFRTFASSAALQDFLLQEASPETLIIVPHQRLARQVWHRQRQQHLAAGHSAWEPLHLLTLGAWWRELYRSLWLPQLPAPPLRRLALWAQALEAGPALEGTQPDLAWAKALDETYETLFRHQLPGTEPRFDDPPVVAWRRQVTEIYEELLQGENLLTPARMAGLLIRALDEGHLRLPEQILVVGLETPAPLEEAWLTAIARRTHLTRVQVRGNPEAVEEAYVFANPEEELEWAAARLVAWRHHEAVPLHRMAVTSPVMDDYAPRFRRVLAELLGPEERHGAWSYNFSAGPGLYDTPLFAAALLPLRFAALGERREDLIALLLSPFFHALQTHQPALAHWDRIFREQRLVQGWKSLRAAVGHKFKPQVELLDHLEQCFAALAGPSRSIRNWLAGFEECWRLLGFPGELLGAEAVQHRRLLDLLHDLSQALNQVTLTASEFLEWLTHGAREIMLPGAGVQDAGLQILGLLEMRGLDFDRIVCLGMNSGSLPAPPRPLFLLSPEEKNQVLGGTYTSQHQFAADLYANLLGCAPRLTLTRPHLANDEEQVGTPLYTGQWQTDLDWKPILNQPHPAWLLAPSVRAAFTMQEEGMAPQRQAEALCLALPRELHVTHLQTALACPCRFLFEVLLAIHDLPDIEAGLPPLDRGIFLHKVLARFVERYRDVLAQRSWQDDEAWQIMKDSVHEILGPRLGDPHWEAERERWLGREGLLPGLLAAWLTLEKERHQQGWRWLTVELPFQGLTKAGWPFSLKGRIDRLDYHEDSQEVLVWDYKSGELPAATRIFERLEEIQLPSYLAALKQDLLEEVLAAASPRAGFIGLKSTRDKHLKHQDFGKTAAHWDEVLMAWEDLVSDVAQRLEAGDFRPDPRPAPLKNNQGACQYCLYHLLCGFSFEEAQDTEGEEE
jgi:ATP-dependent helicase/nuclease subunit B